MLYQQSAFQNEKPHLLRGKYFSTYIKVNFGEKRRHFTKRYSHLIAIENTKIKRGDQKTFYLIALGMVKL